MTLGSDNIVEAPLLTLGILSEATPSENLSGETVMEWRYKKTAWWRFQVPSDWAPGDVLRVDCLESQVDDPAAVHPFVVLTDNPELTNQSFNDVYTSGNNPQPRGDRLFDVDVTSSLLVPDAFVWIGMGLLNDSTGDMNYVLRAGKLIETPISTETVQPAEPVLVWRDFTRPDPDPTLNQYQVYSGNMLRWGTPMTPGIGKLTMPPYATNGRPGSGLSAICNYEPGDNYHGIVTIGMWTYIVASFDPEFCATRRLDGDLPHHIMRGVIKGIYDNGGEDYDYEGTGDKWPMGWTKYTGGPWNVGSPTIEEYAFYTFRKEYANPGTIGLGGGFDYIGWTSVHRAGRVTAAGLDIPKYRNDAAYTYLSREFEKGKVFQAIYGRGMGWANSYLPYDPERGGSADVVRPEGSEVVFDGGGKVLSRRLHVAIRTAQYTTWLAGGDKLLIGLWKNVGYQGKQFNEVISNMTLMGVYPIEEPPTDIPEFMANQSAVEREYSVYTIELGPDFEFEQWDEITAVVSTSLSDEWPTMPTTPGIVDQPPAYTEEWNWWEYPYRSYEDEGRADPLGQGMAVTALVGIEYTWQPPAYHFEGVSRSTEVGDEIPLVNPLISADLGDMGATFDD